MSMSLPGRTAIALVTVLMVLPGLLWMVSPEEGDPTGGDVGPVAEGTRGRGEGIEPAAVTPDPYRDRFRALLPWPTNTTLYGVHWRPGGDYALMPGSFGSLFKYTRTSIEKIETAIEDSLYDVAWNHDGSRALIVGNNSAMFLWNATSGELDPVKVPGLHRFLGATWIGETDEALVVGMGGYLARFNGTGLSQMATGVTDFIYRIAWSPRLDAALAVGDGGLLLRANATEVQDVDRLDVDWGLWRIALSIRNEYSLIVGRSYGAATPRALVVRYNDTGSFDRLTVPGNPAAGLRSVMFAESDIDEYAVIAGENSTVLRWAGTALTNMSAPGDRTLRGCTYEAEDHPSTIVVVGNRGVVLRYDGGWQNVSYDPRGFLHSVAWRPQGDYGLAVGRDGTLVRLRESGSSGVDSGTGRDLFDVDWASDGSYALLCGAGGSVLRYEHATGTVSDIKPLTAVQDLHGISVKPGANVALAVGNGGHVWHWAAGLWTDKKQAGDSRNLRAVAWRPDGEFAIIVGVSGAMLNYTGGRVEAFSPQPLTFAPFFSVEWNKDGTQAMVVGGMDATKDHDTIYVYNNVNWGPVGSDEGVAFYGCAFTADGEVGVALGDPDVIVKFSTRAFEGVRSNFRSPYTLVQRGAMHPTGRAVYFVGSRGYAYRMDVGQFVNDPPVAVIAQPAANRRVNVSEPLDLSAEGSWDPDDDPLTFTWESNVTGFLASGRVARVALDDPGWHRIALWVDDGQGHNVSQVVIIRVVVPNYPPVPVIELPLDGSRYTNEDVVVLDANGTTDPNGDPITYHWVSTVQGDLGYEQRVETTLRVGEHTIILWVEDDGGERVFVSVEVTVVQANRPPNAYITAPVNGQTFLLDEAVELNGSYSNDPDGDPLLLLWSSSVDGALGQGSVVLVADLTLGPHVITLTVDDGQGHVVARTVNVTIVEPVNEPPQISLSSPPSNTTVKGQVVVTGLALDPEGEELLVRYAIGRPEDWTEATLAGNTWSFTWDTTVLPNSQVTVFVEAYDGESTERVWAQYFVDNPAPVNNPPAAALVAPQPGRVEGSVVLEGTASDPDGDAIEKVEVRIDDGFWEGTTGAEAWSFYWDTRKVPNGRHTVSVRAFDGVDWSPLAQYEFTVRNEEVSGGGGSWTTLVGLVLIIALLAAVVLVVSRFRGPRR